MKHATLLLMWNFFACFGALQAAPEGFHLMAGEAKPPTVDANGALTIESGKQAVIHWDHFSIGEGQVVRFAQKDSRSAVLNRVVGLSDSQIEGLLLSNGKVFLVNKNGVVIGPHGRIETAAFIGSTLDLLNEDFLKGQELLFKGASDKMIVNLGEIEALAGDVFLIGSRVKNRGTIKTPQGEAFLAPGREILLKPEGQERVFIRIPVPDEGKAEEAVQILSNDIKNGIRPYAKAIKTPENREPLDLDVLEKEGRSYLVTKKTKSLILKAGSGYTLFFKSGGAATPIPPSVVQIAVIANTTANTTVTNILTPATIESNSDVMQGPSTQGETNPLQADDHSVPYNNDERDDQNTPYNNDERGEGIQCS